MPWNYEIYRPRTERYGAAYYGMLAGPPRDRQWRYDVPKDSRDSRRSEFGTASRGMHCIERSQRIQSRRAASEVSANHRYHRSPSSAEGRTVSYGAQANNCGSCIQGARNNRGYYREPISDPGHMIAPSRRSEAAHHAESASRSSSRRPISSGYYSEPSDILTPSSMLGQVSTSRNSSDRAAGARLNLVHHGHSHGSQRSIQVTRAAPDLEEVDGTKCGRL
jgi:hypothetical protein